MSHHSQRKGSVFGSSLLLAGSCIGAGMLALPVITGMAGLIPSLVILVLSWAFMVVAGLLLLEVNLSLGYHYSLISLASMTLGKLGKRLTWFLFCFLFYSLHVAYVVASGSLIQSLLQSIGISISYSTASCTVVFVMGIIVMRDTYLVDWVNRVFMLGKLLTYLVLVCIGSFYVQPMLWNSTDWKWVMPTIPVLVIAFGFHNMIPSLANYLSGNVVRLRKALLWGSLLPLGVYVVWELIMLGILPQEKEGKEALLHAIDHGQAIASVLQKTAGYSFLTRVVQGFSLFAILTSYITQTLSFVDFLSDGLHIPAQGFRRLYLVLLVILPPLCIGYIYPDIFIKALQYAGGFAAVLLFGALPTAMVWRLRYQMKSHHHPLVPFGKWSLILIAVGSLFIFILQIVLQATS